MPAISIPERVRAIAPAQFDILNTRAAELRVLGHDVISLGQALPGFGPPPAALEAARSALASADTHIYSADAGRRSLREIVCERLRVTDGADVTADELIITAGGNQAFMLALLTVVDKGAEVLLPAPYFVNHEMAVRAVGAVPKEVALAEAHGFALRWEDIESHISRRTRAVVACTPSNPTGAVIHGSELGRLARELAARDIVLLVDETYARFVYDGTFRSAAALPAWRRNVVVTSTFSKSFGMTGWRVGYLAAGRSVCDEAIKIQDAMIICAPVISQVAVEAAVRTHWNYPTEHLDDLAARRALLGELLQAIPQVAWTPTAGGFFAFVRVDGCRDSVQLARDILERAHVVTIPGSTFGASGEGYLRLSYSAVPEATLRQAIGRMAGFFRGSLHASAPSADTREG